MRQTISTVLANYYFGLWGKNEESLKNLKELGLESKVATFLKVVFWYLILGPQLFAFLFVFSAAFKMAHYAWFNYATHVYSEGSTTIVNLDFGFYKFVNFVSFGLYYHKNHHLRPSFQSGQACIQTGPMRKQCLKQQKSSCMVEVRPCAATGVPLRLQISVHRKTRRCGDFAPQAG
jgi:hypothetical protein